MTTHGSRRRLGIATAVTLGAVLAFGVLGGSGFAGSLVKPNKAQYGQYGKGQYNNASKVTVCHKGKVTIRIAAAAVPAHKAHGDSVGACAQTSSATTKQKNAKDDDETSSDSSNAKPGNGKSKN